MSAARAAARNKPVIVVKAGPRGQGRAGRGLAHRRARRLRRRLSTPPSAAPACCASTRCRSCSSRPRRWRASARNRERSADHHDQRRRRRRAGRRRRGARRRRAAPSWAPTLLARLDAVLPPTWSHANPIDIIGDAPVERYAETLQALLADPDDRRRAVHARADRDRAQRRHRARLRCRWCAARRGACWPAGSATPRSPRRASVFEEAGVADYETPEEAVRAFAHAGDLPPQPGAAAGGAGRQRERRARHRPRARAIVATALADGREMLDEVREPRRCSRPTASRSSRRDASRASADGRDRPRRARSAIRSR